MPWGSSRACPHSGGEGVAAGDIPLLREPDSQEAFSVCAYSSFMQFSDSSASWAAAGD